MNIDRRNFNKFVCSLPLGIPLVNNIDTKPQTPFIQENLVSANIVTKLNIINFDSWTFPEDVEKIVCEVTLIYNIDGRKTTLKFIGNNKIWTTEKLNHKIIKNGSHDQLFYNDFNSTPGDTYKIIISLSDTIFIEKNCSIIFDNMKIISKTQET